MLYKVRSVNKIRRIIVLIITIVIGLSNTVYGKYTYNFDETIAIFTRNDEKIAYNISYSTLEWTNQNVILTITSNKELQQASGFNLSEDKKILTKEFSRNTKDKITIRDLSGNCEELEYDISNIDKEMPQIIGCEDGGIYSSELILDYTDNIEVKEVFVDQYDDNLCIETYNNYYDSSFYYGIDKTDTTLTVHVSKYPKNTKKYRYYINNELYMTSSIPYYTFTGLNKGTEYEIKVEAIDKLGNVIDCDISNQKTSYYKSISSVKNNNFTATFEGLDNSVAEIRYAVWNTNNNKDVQWYNSFIKDNSAIIKCIPYDSIYYDSYTMHVYLYDNNNNILDLIEFSVDFGTNFKESSEIDTHHLTEPGKYLISVRDLADNEVIYCIKVE